MKKKLLVLLLLLSLVATCLLLTACKGGGFGEDDDDWKTVRLEGLSVETRRYKLGEPLLFHVKTTPNDFNLDPAGNEWKYERLSVFVYYTVQDKYVKIDRNNGDLFSIPHDQTGEELLVYAVYCAHSEPHELFEGDLVSDATRVTCETAVVTTAEELKAQLAQNATFALGADIDLEGEEWTPVAEFSGALWGMGHTVSNFKITVTSTDNVGFFATLSGTVRDLHLTDAVLNVRGDGKNVGILAGTVKGSSSRGSRVQNVTVNGDINAGYYDNVGGMIGNFEGDGTIVNAKNLATVKGQSYVGGICGRAAAVRQSTSSADDSVADSIKSCVNEGAVSGKSNVGGIAGYYTTDQKEITITGLVNSGEISGTTAVGGLFGEVTEFAALSELINNAPVTGSPLGSKVGGVVGSTTNVQAINYCQTNGDVSGGTYVGGICGYAPNANIKSDNIENNSSVSGISYVGGFAGYAGLIERAVNNAEVTVTGASESGEAALGGIAGYCTGLINCVNNADVIASYRGNFVGGLAGLVEISANDIIVGNVNNGSVSALGERVGGLVGKVSTAGGGTTYTVSENENNGTVTAKGYVGGIFGEVKADAYVSVSLLTNKGEITGEIDGSCTGGLVGGGTRLAKIAFCTNMADVTGGTYVGGLIGYSVDVNIKAGGIANQNIISGISYVGGFAGRAGVIEDAENNGEILLLGLPESGDAYLGGIAGQCAALLNCKNHSDIIVEEKGNFVGGLAGLASVEGIGECIIGCENNGNVSSGGNIVGGIVGRLYSAQPGGKYNETHLVRGNVNNGRVTGANVVGGIIGCVLGTYVTIRDCPWCGYTTYYKYFEIKLCTNNGVVTGESYFGGIVGTQTQLTNAGTLGETNTTLEGDYIGSAATE